MTTMQQLRQRMLKDSMGKHQSVLAEAVAKSQQERDERLKGMPRSESRSVQLGNPNEWTEREPASEFDALML